VKHIDLFSGIGGFALAVDEVWPGAEHIFCEIDPYCQALLKKRFEGSVIFDDIRKLKGDDIWQEDMTISAQDVGNAREPSMVHTARNAQSQEQPSGEKVTLNEKDEMIESGRGNKKKKYTPTTEINACVAEKQSQHFSLSTIKRTMETPKESCINLKHGRLLLSEDSQMTTKSSASTAILPNSHKDNARTKGVQIDILTAGVPCQPASQAGKRRGTKDDRWLWGEAFRIIRETQPRFVILENVRGILTLESGMVFKSLLAEMEGCGYETRAYIIPAVAVNAPHRRDRVWFVAHRKYKCGGKSEHGCKREWTESLKERTELLNSFVRKDSNAPDTESGSDRRYEREVITEGQSPCGSASWEQNWLEVATELCGVDDGLPAELDGLKLSRARHRVERLKALGNAIVPQVAVEIMKAIEIARRLKG